MSTITRRQFLATTSLATGTVVFGHHLAAAQAPILEETMAVGEIDLAAVRRARRGSQRSARAGAGGGGQCARRAVAARTDGR